jgi:diaminohydroxyphosphoribosylaminopyrimidine deaminase/5-amino-6-(5-phosphoribosylamino)uracil reductase
MFSPLDEQYMRAALALAVRGLNTTTPNPRVGCVLVRGDEVVGRGWHERAGEAHAEVMAIADAGSHRAKGATAYVTLEPCSHFGRTPPCAEALRHAGVARVIVAMQDPNPLVGGRGLQQLRDAGIEVRCGLLADEAADLNPGFIKRMTQGLPWIRAKSALSLDGRTALPDGTSQWITCAEARDDGHIWRARACAVLTGIGTVRKDNPRMNVRAIATSRQPLRVVVDARFEIDPAAAVLAGGDALVVTVVDPELPVFRDKAQQLRDRGIEVVGQAEAAPGGKVNLRALARMLADRGCNEVHLEAGARLTGAMVDDDLIDEWLLYLAPLFLGDGMPVVGDGRRWPSLGEVPRWRWKDQSMVGETLRLRLVRR